VEIKKESRLLASAHSREQNFATPRAPPSGTTKPNQSPDIHFSVAVRNDFAVQLYISTMLMKQNCDF
jgi:hypothetical protein